MSLSSHTPYYFAVHDVVSHQVRSWESHQCAGNSTAAQSELSALSLPSSTPNPVALPLDLRKKKVYVLMEPEYHLFSVALEKKFRWRLKILVLGIVVGFF